MTFSHQVDEATKQRTAAWMWLGVYALCAAGVLSILLALARTPGVSEFLPGTDFFHVALVVHVNLSVLVWFMACAGMVWTWFSGKQTNCNTASLGMAVIGTVMISVAPFVGAEKSLMNNYIPMLQHSWFYTGLSTLAAGLAGQALCYLRHGQATLRADKFLDVIRFALALAALTILIALACVGWAWLRMPAGIEGERFFEFMFWGGGHVQQFTNTILALVAWLMLARASGSRIWLPPKLGVVLFALVAAPLLFVPWIYRLPVDSAASIQAFTELMKWGGLAAAPLCLILVAAFLRRGGTQPNEQPIRAALVCSLSLFAAGGLLGFMIKGSNTMIPAHYHGSIVGVTLAFMGVVYCILPRLGCPITFPRLLGWQPYVYSAGQLLHISGLAMSGGYGVQRKVAGADQALNGLAQTVGMGMMGLGGLLAALGGLFFVMIVICALRRGAPLGLGERLSAWLHNHPTIHP